MDIVRVDEDGLVEPPRARVVMRSRTAHESQLIYLCSGCELTFNVVEGTEFLHKCYGAAALPGDDDQANAKAV